MATAVIPNDPRAAVLRQLVEGAWEQGEARGLAEGEARAVLAVLGARGVVVTDAARERIAACRDLDVLDAWLRAAVSATTVEELFAPA